MARKTTAPLPRHADDQQSITGYILQGASFIGFLLMLFLLAGFRG